MLSEGGESMEKSIGKSEDQYENIRKAEDQSEGQTANLTRFEKLWVWQKSHKLMLRLDSICKSLPKDERYRLKDQILRSSSSVPDNIAEGNSAYYYNDKIKAFYVARKEAGETQNHIFSLAGKKYITTDLARALISEYEEVVRGLNGLIRSTIEKRNNSKSKGSKI
jgi:four helix bundle protein